MCSREKFLQSGKAKNTSQINLYSNFPRWRIHVKEKVYIIGKNMS